MKLKHYPLVAFLEIISVFLHLIYLLLTIIKWAVAPIVLIFQILFLCPYVKLKFSFLKDIKLYTINEKELSNEIWISLQQDKKIFKENGFIGKDKIIYTNILNDNTRSYCYHMINKEKQLGVGLNYAVLQDKNKIYNIIEYNFIEFTLETPDGKIIDFHNNNKEIIDTYKNRKRYYFEQIDIESFYNIVEKITHKYNYKCPDSFMVLLEKSPEKLIYDEAKLGLQALEENGIIYSNSNNIMRLSWYGTLRFITRSMWPMIELNEYNLYKKTLNYLKTINFSIEDMYNKTLEYKFGKEKRYNKIINTLEDLQEIINQSKYQFKFTPTHKLTSAVFYLDYETFKVISVDAYLQYYEHIEDRNIYKISNYHLSFNNEEMTCFYNKFGTTEYTNNADEITTPLDNISKLIPLEKIIEIAKKKEKQTNMQLFSIDILILDKKPTWQIHLYKEDNAPKVICIDAINGKEKKLYDNHSIS